MNDISEKPLEEDEDDANISQIVDLVILLSLLIFMAIRYAIKQAEKIPSLTCNCLTEQTHTHFFSSKCKNQF